MKHSQVLDIRFLSLHIVVEQKSDVREGTHKVCRRIKGMATMAHCRSKTTIQHLQRENTSLRQEVCRLTDFVKRMDHDRLSAPYANAVTADVIPFNLDINWMARGLALECARRSRQNSNPQISRALEELSVLLADGVSVLEAVYEDVASRK